MSNRSVLEEQRELWSSNPRDWAEIAEPENRELFDKLLDLTGVGRGTRLLDIACGSGYAAALAAARGAEVTGVDIAPALLEIARERTPAGTFLDGGMDALPLPSARFDVVACVNGFQFALDSAKAFAEAARVLLPGGRLAAATFAEPERNEGTALHLAMKALVDEPADDGYVPYALSSPGGLERMLGPAGLRLVDSGEVALAWTYPDVDTTVRALLASAGGARAARVVGKQQVREALIASIKPFRDPVGAVSIRNVFRYVIAVKD
ncbi:MAG TPA: class I SAM-dependent methyltransferase [Solirubrobacteraceae bacterium]|nr:class I SAM-dependent methyltransferase [Solirubrobacteraceae bacterium]